MPKLLLTQIFIILVFSYTWEDYKKEFAKEYSFEDQSLHEAAFNSSMEYIDKINAMAVGYQLGPTQWTDKPTQEIRESLKVSVSLGNAVTAPISEDMGGLRVAAPTSVDWRTSGKVTPIKNQGSCGCCWAFSSAAVIESLFLINNKTNLSVSEEYLLECTTNSSCYGGYVDSALKLVVNTGIPSLSTYPYLGGNFSGTHPSTPGICQSSSTFKLPSDTKFQFYTYMTPTKMMSLASTAPFVALISADTGFMNYKSGIYSCNYTTKISDLNHAITVIGYDSWGNFLIKNSWGTSWGDRGFGWVSGSASGNCGISIAGYTLISGSFSSGEVVGSTKWGWRLALGVLGVMVLVIL